MAVWKAASQSASRVQAQMPGSAPLPPEGVKDLKNRRKLSHGIVLFGWGSKQADSKNVMDMIEVSNWMLKTFK